MLKKLSLFLFVLIGATHTAQSKGVYLEVGTAKTKKPSIAIPSPKSDSDDLAGKMKRELSNALNYAELFRVVPESAYPVTELEGGVTPQGEEWSKIGADFVLGWTLTSDKEKTVAEIHLYQTPVSKNLLSKRYVSSPTDWKVTVRTAANDIVEAITGSPSVFKSQIAAVCDRSGKKEVYVFDFDGSNPKQVTQHRSTTVGPAWNKDGTKLAYSVYNRHGDNTKNLDLFEFDFTKKLLRLLSNKTGINSGANYDPKLNRIALTLSYLGNPEIFLLNPDSREATRLTRSIGVDVDPSFSPDGKRLAFVSSRSGNPMIYIMPVDQPNSAKRLTYAGKYNASPSFGPDGKKIAFAGWIDSRFDLFIMNADGTNIERLTKNEGTNEDPNFSPDGRFIAFSSSREGTRSIYVINVEGNVVKRLTFGLGNCVAPKWSPALN
jgi:TolB protein